MTQIFALGNKKGGVGKSTMTLALASELASQGRGVLVVDLDPQANMTTAIHQPVPGEANIWNVLDGTGTTSIADAIVATRWDDVDLIPGSSDLQALERDTRLDAYTRLRKILRAPEARVYDDILIDLPPASGTATVSGIMAANRVIVVTDPLYWGRDGLDDFMALLDEARDSLAADFTLAGVLINRYDKRLNHHQAGRLELMRTRSDQLLNPAVPERTSVVDISTGTPAHDIKSGRDAADAIRRIATHLATTAKDLP